MPDPTPKTTAGLDPDRDVMQDEWCCMTCYARFKFGKLRMKPTGLGCPTCGSVETAAADGRIYQ